MFQGASGIIPFCSALRKRLIALLDGTEIHQLEVPALTLGKALIPHFNGLYSILTLRAL